MASILTKILNLAINEEISDIHLSANNYLYLRKQTKLYKQNTLISLQDINDIIQELLDEQQLRQLIKTQTLDCAYEFNKRRFRLNIYATECSYAIALRLIRQKAISLATFPSYNILKQIITKTHGLILICGATGSGKSTTLASIIDYLNKYTVKHIITLEEPIEFTFTSEKSLIHQREQDKHFIKFNKAIKAALRQDPDVLMIGEIRDSKTLKATLTAAETGHLVLATCHATNTSEALMRIESLFAAKQIQNIRTQIANCLNAIIAQQLILTKNENLACAMEILIANTAVKNTIRQGRYEQIPSQIQLHKNIGMQTMTEAINAIARRNNEK